MCVILFYETLSSCLTLWNPMMQKIRVFVVVSLEDFWCWINPLEKGLAYHEGGDFLIIELTNRLYIHKVGCLAKLCSFIRFPASYNISCLSFFHKQEHYAPINVSRLWLCLCTCLCGRWPAAAAANSSVQTEWTWLIFNVEKLLRISREYW